MEKERKQTKLQSVLRVMLCFALILGMVSASAISADAATVTKVKRKQTYSGGFEYNTISGYTSSNKKVWSLKLKKVSATQVSQVNAKMRGNYLYVTWGRHFYRLNVQTGKVMVTKKKLFKYTPGGAAMYIDASGNLYIVGYLSRDLYKVSPKGKILWKKSLDNSLCWPYKIQQKGDNIQLTFEAEWSHRKAQFRMKDGEFVKYID